MKINEAGIALIKQFEGCKLSAYKDIVGIWTIGYGETGPHVTEGMKISKEAADSLLITSLSRFEKGVSDCVAHASITSNQFSALVCFAFNVGLGNMKSSTLLKMILAGDMDEAANQFLRWDRAGGKQVAGLTRRRLAERALFVTDQS